MAGLAAICQGLLDAEPIVLLALLGSLPTAGIAGIAGGIMLAAAMILASRDPHRVTTPLLRHDVGKVDPVKSNPKE